MATKHISISIPQPLYQRVQRLVETHHQSLDVVLETAVILAESNWPLTTPPELAMAEEERAYRALHSELIQQYAGHYVAIFQGQLVDTDANELALLHRIEANYADNIVLLKQVRPLPEPELRLRSPRLVPHNA